MKRVLIIEDEYDEVKNAFEYVKDIYYSGEMELTNVIKSQDIPFQNLERYDVIFLDITLAKRSKMDGYGILKKIEQENISYNKLVIMTGNNKISYVLKEREILGEYEILAKPLDFKELKLIIDG
jgi:DNA-binding NtrC family response regulator